jgi:hypothetical protein
MFSTEWIIRFHTILIGASPLIPIPFLDELIVFYLRRHLVSEIAKKHNRNLSSAEMQPLADEQANGCMGAFAFLIILPLKEMFREIFFWLEWKRGIDLATQTYYFGYLLDVILKRDDFNPKNAQVYRQAIKESLLGFQTERLREVIKQTFTSSRAVVREVRRWLFQFGKYYLKLIISFPVKKGRQLVSRFRKRKDIEYASQNDYADKLDDFFEGSKPEVSHLSENLSKSLESGIGNLPGHFEQLSRRLDDRLAFYSDPQNLSRFLSKREQHSVMGMASFWAGLLALSTVLVILGGLYSQRYWDLPAISFVVAWLPCITAFLILMGAGTGFVSLFERDHKNVFGVIGLLISGLTALTCCFLFGLIFVSRSGFGG